MVVDWKQLKSRYLQDDISTRLGGIVSLGEFYENSINSIT